MRLLLLLSLISLSACNKGITKGSKSRVAPLEATVEKSVEKSLELPEIIDYRKASGYSCKVSMIDGEHPLFIEVSEIDGEKKYSHFFAANKDANTAIDKQLDFKRELNIEQDKELLAQLGFSKKQIVKIAEKEATTIETQTVIYFDENELGGYIERTAETRDQAGKLVRESVATIGELTDCMESEMDVEI